MALATAAYEAELLGILTDMESRTTTAKAEFASRWAAATETFIKTGTVPPGIPVATAGSATAQTGATTAPGTII